VAESDPDIQGAVEYGLWICAGCETGVLEVKESDSESFENDGSTEFRVKHFPKRLRSGVEPKRFKKLGRTLKQIYMETIESFNSESLLLTTAGIRALLEGVCEDKGVSGRNLASKINNLKTILPSQNIIDALHHFRFIGNDAVHKLKAPEAENVRLAIKVMEDLLSYLYDLEYNAKRLMSTRSRTP